jgi:peroxiredoxin
VLRTIFKRGRGRQVVRQPPRLVPLDPHATRQAEFVLAATELSVGSDDNADVVLREPTVSRRHAIIRLGERHAEVVDLSSTNGTFVNGRRVNRQRIFPGDEVRFGAVRLVVCNPIGHGGDGATPAGQQGAARMVAFRTAAEAGVVALIIGFALAQSLAYLTYRERERLMLASAVPLPASRLPATEAQPSAAEPTVAGRSPTTPVPAIRRPRGEPGSIETGAPEVGSAAASAIAGAIELARLFPRSGRNAGRLAAPFRLQDLDGKWISSESLRGKVVLFNVWATWCGPCRREMPALNALYEQLRANPGFELLAVSVDERSADSVRDYINRGGYTFPVLLDPGGRVAAAYGVRGIPHTFIVDRGGHIAWDVVGAPDWASASVRDALGRML